MSEGDPTSDVSHGEMMRSLGRIEGALDAILAANAIQNQRIEAVEIKTDTVAKRQAWWSGMAAACGAIAGYFLKYFSVTPHG